MPARGVSLKPKADLLSFEEIATLAGMFVSAGIRKIRITGGEPLVRNDVVNLCRSLATLPGLQALGISTNGVLLESKVQELWVAGVRHVNISLDTLSAVRFHTMALRHSFSDVMRGIESAVKTGFPSIKVNVVVLRDFNDDELVRFVDFANRLSLHIRFIEYMPFVANGWNEKLFVPCSEMKRKIEEKYELSRVDSGQSVSGPAHMFTVRGGRAVVGFIPTLSEPFCRTCNRLRLSADGMLSTCLFSGYGLHLGKLIRSGVPAAEIMDRVRSEVGLKWKEHPGTARLVEASENTMVAVGG